MFRPSRLTTRGSSCTTRCELAVADVDGDDARGAALEQHLGEPAGRRAGIQGDPPGRVDRERVERRR